MPSPHKTVSCKFQVCLHRCVWECVSPREKERRSLQASSQMLWGCSSSDKRGRDSPSVSVDSGPWKHAGQVRAACDKKSLFPWESNLSQHSCSPKSAYSSVYLEALLYLSQGSQLCWTEVYIFKVLRYAQLNLLLQTGALNDQLLVLWCEGWSTLTGAVSWLCFCRELAAYSTLKKKSFWIFFPFDGESTNIWAACRITRRTVSYQGNNAHTACSSCTFLG